MKRYLISALMLGCFPHFASASCASQVDYSIQAGLKSKGYLVTEISQPNFGTHYRIEGEQGPDQALYVDYHVVYAKFEDLRYRAKQHDVIVRGYCDKRGRTGRMLGDLQYVNGFSFHQFNVK